MLSIPHVGLVTVWWRRFAAWLLSVDSGLAGSGIVLPELPAEATARPSAAPVRPAPAEVSAMAVSAPPAAAPAIEPQAAGVVAPPGAAEARPPVVLPDPDPVLRTATLEGLGKLQQIPALQSLAQGFMRAATRADGSVDEVVQSVEKDPSLCIRVLRMANSASVSPVEKIEDIFTAVHMIGLRRVSTLAQVLFTMRDRRDMAGGLDWRHLWVHALATAAVAEELDRRFGAVAGPQLHLAALLHDVGKIVLATVEPEKYQEIFGEVLREAGRLDRLEVERLGVGHAEAGVLFGKQCGLPEEVVAAIEWHEDPSAAKAYRTTVAVISLANFLSKYYGLGFGGSLLTDEDGDFESQPAWTVLAAEAGVNVDRPQLDREVREFIGGLKPELQELGKAV